MNDAEVDQFLTQAEQTLQRAMSGVVTQPQPSAPQGQAPDLGSLIDERLRRVIPLLAALPGKDGENGVNGTSVTLEDVKPLIEEAVAKIPVPKDGKDGKDGKHGRLERVIKTADYERLKAPDGAAQVTFTQSGTGAIAGTVAGQLQKFGFLSDFDSSANYDTFRDALTGTMAVPRTIEFAPHPVSQANAYVMSVMTGNPIAARWNFVISDVANAGTVDTGFSMGYNAAPSAGRRDATEPSWMWTIEHNYNDGLANYMEMHWQGIHADGTSFRHSSWQINRSSKTTTHFISLDTYVIGDRTGANQAFIFRGLTTTAGELQVGDGSALRAVSNNEYWLRQGNAAGSGSIELMRIDASDRVLIAPEGGITKINGVLQIPNGATTADVTNLSFSTSGGEQFRVNHIASAVNVLAVQGAATGGGVFVRSFSGSDTNVNINYSTQGSGAHGFFSTGTSAQQFQITHTASASRFIRVTGSNGAHPSIDTNNAASFVGIGRSIVMTSQPSWFIQEESDTDPTTAELDAGDSAAVYNKNGKIVIAYNLAGTMNFLSCLLDGSTVTWVNSTVAP